MLLELIELLLSVFFLQFWDNQSKYKVIYIKMSN